MSCRTRSGIQKFLHIEKTLDSRSVIPDLIRDRNDKNGKKSHIFSFSKISNSVLASICAETPQPLNYLIFQNSNVSIRLWPLIVPKRYLFILNLVHNNQIGYYKRHYLIRIKSLNFHKVS